MFNNRKSNPQDKRPKTDRSDEKKSSNVPDYLLPNGQIDWGVALRENERWMRSTIALRVGEAAAVDEVFQEVALAATSQKAPLRDVAKLGSWLYRLVVIQSALYRRKVGRKRKLLKRYAEEVISSQNQYSQTEPIDWLLSKERQTMIRNALATLSEEERNILLMNYRDELSYRDLAAKLHSTELAVQSKLHRARARLKRAVLKLSNGQIGR